MATHLARHHSISISPSPISKRVRFQEGNKANSISESPVNTADLTFVSVAKHSDTSTSDSDTVHMQGVGQLRMQSFLQNKSPLTPGSALAQLITRHIGLFIAHDMRPFSVVENTGFKKMVTILEPRYNLPSRTHFATNVIPRLYSESKEKLSDKLNDASNVSLTTDGWTARGANSYVTITVHFIDQNWEIQNHVLQTRLFNESHTATNLSTILLNAVDEWKLNRDGLTIPVTSDNAANIINAVQVSESLGPNIRCFAHTINLASQKGLAVPSVNRILGKIRKIASYFHHSPLGSHILHVKQDMIEIPQHNLIIDVSTRWNSSFDMINRYREQHEAVFLASIDLKKSNKDIAVPNDEEMSLIDDIIEVMGPLKTVTTILCSEKIPTVSIILPLKTKIINSMNIKQTDSKTVKDLKSALSDNLAPRYGDQGLLHFLEESTTLDQRFKIIQNFDEDEIYSRIADKCLNLKNDKDDDIEELDDILEQPVDKKPKTALEDLLCDIVENDCNSHINDKNTKAAIQEEIKTYKNIPKAPMNSDPLQWLKINACRIPHLARLAKIHLCVPGTSVPSERVFSTAGDIVTAQRNFLSSEHVDTLVFLKKNVSLMD
ncbi:hypothetical protein SNE40_020592 [Patella caerulea]|uniref:HAT C-terminal dimerisation domain-containing protein n=1 Tax=Patella caerulea TaxID=87958 RepID=A0AAN8P7I1_PATCE